MEEPHLVVEADALERSGAFGHHQPVAEAQHRIDGISRRASRSRRELELGRRHDLFQRPEVNSGGVPFDTAYVVARHRVNQPRDPLPNLFATVGEALAAYRVLLVTRPAANDPPAVLQLRRDNSPRQLQRAGVVHDRLEEGFAEVDVAGGRATYEEANGAAPAQGRDAHTPLYTCIQCLHGDLRPAQHDYRVDRLERDTLAPFG